MNDTQRQAMRDAIQAIHFALIENERTKEGARRQPRIETEPTAIPMPQIKVKLTDAEIIEDVEWLIEAREHPGNIAKRVSKTPSALSRWLHRRGRHDLARHFERQEAAA